MKLENTSTSEGELQLVSQHTVNFLFKQDQKVEKEVQRQDNEEKVETYDPTTSSSTKPQSIAVPHDDPVVKNLVELHEEFVDLVDNVKNALHKLVENRTLELIQVASKVGEYSKVKGLTKVTNIYELFEELWPCYSYLNCEIIEFIVKKYLVEQAIQKDMDAYKKNLEIFTTSTSLTEFKEAVEKALIPKPKVTASTCEVVIKLNPQWGDKKMEIFETLVNHIFRHKMTHIHVDKGSVCVTLIIPRSRLDYFLKRAKLMKEFAKLIGIFELIIDSGQPIINEKEEKQFSFDQALEESSKVGNVEAMQFLHYIIKKETDSHAKKLDYYTSPVVLWDQSFEVGMLTSNSVPTTFQGEM